MKFLGSPWLLVVMFAGGLATGWLVNGWRINAGIESERDKELDVQQQMYASRDSVFAVIQKKDAALASENAELRDRLSNTERALDESISRQPLVKTITKVVHDENGDHACSIATRGDAYRLCINAAYAGDSIAAAACEAAGGHGGLSTQ
jgi:hypothetical protein